MAFELLSACRGFGGQYVFSFIHPFQETFYSAPNTEAHYFNIGRY